MKILVSLFLALIMSAPMAAQAAWWDSWLKNGAQSVTTTSKAIETPEPKKAVEKVAQVDNPELQSRINALVAENTKLRNQLNSQVTTLGELNQCRLDLAQLKNQSISSFSTDCSKARERYKNAVESVNASIERAIAEIDAYYEPLIAKLEQSKLTGSGSPSLYENRVKAAKQEYESKIKSIKSTLRPQAELTRDNALRDIEAYCK
jgi:hypothetical protein